LQDRNHFAFQRHVFDIKLLKFVCKFDIATAQVDVALGDVAHVPTPEIVNWLTEGKSSIGNILKNLLPEWCSQQYFISKKNPQREPGINSGCIYHSFIPE
jgi:hypothetical protein